MLRYNIAEIARPLVTPVLTETGEIAKQWQGGQYKATLVKVSETLFILRECNVDFDRADMFRELEINA